MPAAGDAASLLRTAVLLKSGSATDWLCWSPAASQGTRSTHSRQVSFPSSSTGSVDPPRPRVYRRGSSTRGRKLTSIALQRRLDRPELYAWLALLGVGMLLSWLCQAHPTALPAWAPWDFSWTEFLAASAALWWFGRGLTRTAAALRPAPWRQLSFLLGLLVLYGVLQTRFLYLSQHMFFLNRLQHLAMHHLGPFLIALGWPGEMIRRGMPAPVRRLVDLRPIRLAVRARAATDHRRGAVRRPDRIVADPASAFPRDGRPAALRGDELEHGGRRHPVLDPGAGSPPQAAGPHRLRHPHRAGGRGDVPADPDGRNRHFRRSCAVSVLRSVWTRVSLGGRDRRPAPGWARGMDSRRHDEHRGLLRRAEQFPPARGSTSTPGATAARCSNDHAERQ